MGQPEISQDQMRDAQTLWRFHLIESELVPADAIVGLGSYDLRVAERCAELLHEGLAATIIFTGASGNWTRGLFEGSEASAFAARAMERGVPEDAIILEEQATNIGENVRHVAELLAGDATVIFVTKPQTQRRCYATVQRQWPSATAMVTAPRHGLLDQPTRHMPLRGLICEMVGDVHRMQTYPALGFQSHQDIPEDVELAYRRLLAAGFTDHVPTD